VTPQPRGRYFLLSYAHSPPLSTQRPGDLDLWVKRFFDDLDAAVTRHRSTGSLLNDGLFDQGIPLGSDWKAALAGALETAEVLVPLYSSAYFSRMQSGREWECFRRRMLRAGVPDPMSRFVPVLWTPVLSEQHRAWAGDAPLFTERVPAYAENGLQALLRLKVYEDAYRTVVELLAERIVGIAENHPVGPSAADDVDRLESPFEPEAAVARFAVTVAAPTRENLPPGRDATAYGAQSAQWRPFPAGHELALAAYARLVAERLDFAVLVSDAGKLGDDHRDRPGIMLIDPWFVATDGGAATLRTLTANLPSWVLPVVVVDREQGDPRILDLARETRDIVTHAREPRGSTAGRAAQGIDSFQEFVALVPFLIVEAGRRYLRTSPIQGSAATTPEARPRLSRDPRAVPGREADD
jgi:FxsC-like protein